MATAPYKKRLASYLIIRSTWSNLRKPSNVTEMIFQSTFSPKLPFCGKQYRVYIKSYNFVMLYYKAIIKAARIAKRLLYRMIARNRFSKNYANGRFSHSGSHIIYFQITVEIRE